MSSWFQKRRKRSQKTPISFCIHSWDKRLHKKSEHLFAPPKPPIFFANAKDMRMILFFLRGHDRNGNFYLRAKQLEIKKFSRLQIADQSFKKRSSCIIEFRSGQFLACHFIEQMEPIGSSSHWIHFSHNGKRSNAPFNCVEKLFCLFCNINEFRRVKSNRFREAQIATSRQKLEDLFLIADNSAQFSIEAIYFYHFLQKVTERRNIDRTLHKPIHLSNCNQLLTDRNCFKRRVV